MSKEEKAADATLMTCIAEMELLTKQMEGISEQTIAEILEQEPEMRKEIEEELENNAESVTLMLPPEVSKRIRQASEERAAGNGS